MPKKFKIMEAESTLTDRYQTTIPEPIRDALHLDKRDKISYAIDGDGKVTITRAHEEDPAVGKFLELIAKDIENNENIYALDPELLESIRDLVGDMEVDLDAPLEGDDDDDEDE